MSKDLRIATTAVRFQSRQVSVMSTVPRAWNTGTQLRCLWDPEGVTDPKTGAKLPGGDLVEHFVRFGQHSKTKKDIPDTFALVDTVDDHDGRRVCSWVPSLNRAADQETLRNQSDPRLRKLGSQTGFFNRYA